MGNAFTTTKAPVGQEGFSPAALLALQNNTAASADNAAYLAEAGEQIVYTPGGVTNAPGTPLTFLAVVDRHPMQAVTEDAVVLSDMIEVTFQNDAAAGVTKINVGRDTVTTAGRYGGPVRAHIVSAVVNGTSGLWTVRCK